MPVEEAIRLAKEERARRLVDRLRNDWLTR
jgi:hypothetical protein